MVITNKGGLPETVTNAKILDKLTIKNLEKTIINLIENHKQRKKLQFLSIKNFYLTHEFVTKNIDFYRSEKLQITKKIFIKKNLNNLSILHITNFNERGRLFLILKKNKQ